MLLHPKTKTKKNTPESKPNNSELKRRLLKRIKEHKQGVQQNSVEDKTDEFNSSLEYLSLLKQKNDIKTRKNYNEEKQPSVYLDLPEELMNPAQFTVPVKIDDCIPYSNLKNGTKPMFRDWSKTVRNYSASTNNTVVPPLQAVVVPLSVVPLQSVPLQAVVPPLQHFTPAQKPIQTEPFYITKKRTTTKTIKRKYNLGKSLKHRSVGVLLKDKKSNATVIEAQKQLKTKTIADVKQYLKEHNLIKGGTNAPNDVLRKLYESAMMAGEITNCNKETLLENIF